MTLRIATFALLLATAPALALPEDRNQPIRISADSASRDERTGETEYIGNVQLSQGTLLITADRITVVHDTRTAQVIVATGAPATMTQQPALDQAPINAEARRIEYVRSEERVELSDQARIEQDGAIVTGDTINYLIAKQRVQAISDPNAGGSGRVEVVIPPESVQGES